MRWCLASGGVGIAVGDVGGDGVDAGPGVALQGAHGSVPGAGQQGGGVGAVFRLMRQGGVTERVQGPPAEGREVGGVGDAEC